jgi:hypothetical protein
VIVLLFALLHFLWHTIRPDENYTVAPL